MSLQQLKTIRSLVRNSINEPVQKNFTDPELNAIISLCQNDVIRRLLRVNTVWFASRTQLTGSAPINGARTFTLPSTCGEIVSVVTAAGVSVTIKPLSEIGLLTSDTMHTPSASNPYGVHIENYLYIYPSSISTIYIHFIRKAVELTEETDTTIIPFQFIDILVAAAVAECAPKAGLDVAQMEKKYDEKFTELELRKRRDVDEEESISGERQ